jgi:protein SCO1/2/putative membrane protein
VEDAAPTRRARGLGLRAFLAPSIVVLVVLGMTVVRLEERARATTSPGVYLPLPDFELVERSGAHLTRDALLGRPWIAGFIFTRCQGPCPLVTARMRRLEDELAGADLRLVSVTVDPGHDTPEVLSRYADSVTADKERWLFVTGDPAQVTSLVRDGFHLGVERNPEASRPSDSITHDTHLALVGPDGVVRGYFASDDEASLLELRRQARVLAAPGRRSWLPVVNALLNGTSALLLLLGYARIRRGDVDAHKRSMLDALAVSAAFLGSYVLYHARYGSTPFADEGPARSVYFAILISHVTLAALLVPLVAVTVALALKGKFERHVRLARWTFPIWLYVSVTGVAVYLLLYQIYV